MFKKIIGFFSFALFTLLFVACSDQTAVEKAKHAVGEGSDAAKDAMD